MPWLTIGAVSGFLAVACGAFGAHALDQRLSQNQTQAIYQTGALYHLVHSIPLLVLGLLAPRSKTRLTELAGWAFTLGLVLFSGSLYALAISGRRGFGAITPFGGAAFLIGWAALATLGLKSRADPSAKSPRRYGDTARPSAATEGTMGPRDRGIKGLRDQNPKG